MTIKEIEASVKECYSTWSNDYYDNYYGDDAPYPPVHRDLIQAQLQQADVRHVLDAGCGPASFLRELTKTDLNLYGFDLTPEMVAEGKRIFASLGLPAEHVWEGSVLDRQSFCPPPGSEIDQFDATVCIGVLPHIPESSDKQVIEHLRQSVRPGGMVILEARNQLFSLFTMNRYSYDFIANELIQIEQLQDRSDDESKQLAGALDSFQDHFRMDLPPIRTGKQGEPGYDEVLSRSHNPIVLQQQFEAAGFEQVRTLFYHFHALPPMYQSAAPQRFQQLSIEMEDPNDWRGYFMASAFLLVGRRA